MPTSSVQSKPQTQRLSCVSQQQIHEPRSMGSMGFWWFQNVPNIKCWNKHTERCWPWLYTGKWKKVVKCGAWLLGLPMSRSHKGFAFPEGSNLLYASEARVFRLCPGLESDWRMSSTLRRKVSPLGPTTTMPHNQPNNGLHIGTSCIIYINAQGSWKLFFWTRETWHGKKSCSIHNLNIANLSVFSHVAMHSVLATSTLVGIASKLRRTLGQDSSLINLARRRK